MTGIHEQGTGMTEEVKRELCRRYSILWRTVTRHFGLPCAGVTVLNTHP